MEELIRYFTNLLILQYKNKPKAKATIEALTRNAFSDTQNNIFPIEVQNAYDLDTATGKQLDVLGKYLGYNRMLPIPVDNTFKYAEYDGSVNPNQGYAEYEEDKLTYPFAEYRYSSYDYYPISDDTYRNILKMIASLKGKPLSLGNINDALEIFNGEIYTEEGNKQLIYHILPSTYPILDTQEKLDMFFKKYFPIPMGCGMLVKRPAKIFNLEAVNGAELDEDFIFTNNSNAGVAYNKFFKTKQQINFNNGNIEIKIKFKSTDIRSGIFKKQNDYLLNGFVSSDSQLWLSIGQQYQNAPTLSLDTWYYIKITRENYLWKFYYSTDGQSYNLLYERNYSFSGSYITDYFYIGFGASTGSSYGLIGKIDFKESDFVIDGESIMWI